MATIKAVARVMPILLMDVSSLTCLSNSDETKSASSDSKDSIWLAKKVKPSLCLD